MGNGKLKIFFGYSAGVGKTYAMLQAARTLKEKGVDAVIGYVEPHQRPDTQRLAEAFERIPLRTAEYRGVRLREFDINAALRRRPQLLLVDELAHTNAAGSKHVKRYLDIAEALNAGIDVYTTVNVQHLESLNDIIGGITGIRVQETIPDSVFDDADEVELVDIEPSELEERLRAGKIYAHSRAAVALEHFFTREKLNSLRETAMRRTADRIERRTHTGSAKPHILVLVSPSPSSAKNIRTASRMAETAHTQFYALYVEKTGSLAERCAETLQSHLRLIRSLNGELTVRYGDDIIDIITGFVRQNGITTIILGKTWQSAGKRPGFEDRIVAALPDTEILIIPDSRNSTVRDDRTIAYSKKCRTGTTAGQRVLLAAGALWCAAGFALQTVSAAAAVCAQTLLAFLCCAAVIRSTVRTGKLQLQYRETNRTLDALKAIDRTVHPEQTETIRGVCTVLAAVFGRNVQLTFLDGTDSIVSLSAGRTDIFNTPQERAVCSWVRINGKPAGCGTDTLREAAAAYYPLMQHGRCIAVAAFACRSTDGGSNSRCEPLSLADRLLFSQLESRLAQIFCNPSQQPRYQDG